MPEAAVIETPATSSPAPATGGGFDAALDRSFAGAEKTTAAMDAPGGPPALGTPGEGEQPPTAPEVVTADAVPTETAAVAEEGEQTPVVEEEPDPFAEEIKPDSVSQDGRRLFFNKAKGELLMADRKVLQQVRAIDPTFSPETYQENVGRVMELDRMLNDFSSGDPQRVAQVADQFLNPTTNPETAVAFMDNAMMKAAQHHPQAFQQVQSKLLHTLANTFVNKYRQSGSATDKALAQNLRWLANGAPANPQAGLHYDDLDGTAQPVQNPLAAEKAAFDQQVQQYNLQRNQEKQQRLNAFVTSAETEAKSQVKQAIDSALGIIPAEVRTARANDYKHAVRDLQDQFEEAVKANPIYDRQYKALVSGLYANPTDASKAALVKFVRQHADASIGRMKKEVIGRFTSTVKRNADQLTQKYEDNSKRVEPGGGNNNPVHRATVAQKLNDPNMSWDDKLNMVFNPNRR